MFTCYKREHSEPKRLTKNVPCSGSERPEQVIPGFPQVNHKKNDVHIIGDYLDTRTSIPNTVHHTRNVTPTTLTKSTRERLGRTNIISARPKRRIRLSDRKVDREKKSFITVRFLAFLFRPPFPPLSHSLYRSESPSTSRWRCSRQVARRNERSC
ncbi:hypothetical protein Bpfe_010124 [Biomphalaria pfeifferi]|uniref:Uncharacterized protein n=1 Tax=Biomphalaria pfeifferi TaxID=112525 RepID=A0AAD8FDD7_BIOPF|nr:hypothetical protein Bpfe_010124 [Biomphalaria pfeifferi]